MADPVNPFPELTSQLLSTVAAVRGLGAVFESASASVKTFGTTMQQLVTGTASLGKLVRAFDTLAAAATKATLGMAALGAASLAGGVETFGQVLGIVTSTIGAAVAPVFVVLAAAALAVADMFKDQLIGAGLSLAQWLVGNLIPAVKVTVAAFQLAADGLKAAYLGLKSVIPAQARGLATGLNEMFLHRPEFLAIPGMAMFFRVNQRVMKDMNEQLAENFDKFKEIALKGGAADLAKLGAGGGGGVGNFAKGFAENLRRVLNTLDFELGKRGNIGFAGIGDIGKQIQQQAFQSDLQQKQFNLWLEIRDMLRKAFNEVLRPGFGIPNVI